MTESLSGRVARPRAAGPFTVEYHDDGNGYRRAKVREDCPPDLADVISDQLKDAQPPGSVRDTRPHPVWTLSHEVVNGVGYWCFLVQGKGGPFGAAGTGRAVYVLDTTRPAPFWRDCVAHEIPPTSPDSALINRSVDDVLRGLVAGLPTFRVPGEPAHVAEVLTRVLRVVPREVVRQYRWSTCLLQAPRYGDLRMIAGIWPESFGTGGQRREADAVRHALPEIDVGADLDDRELEAIGWLVGQAIKGIDVTFDGRLTTMRAALQYVAARYLEITWEMVESLVRDEEGLRRLAENPRAVEEWANRRPQAALGKLAKGLPTPVDGVVLDTLVQQTRKGGNALAVPGAGVEGPVQLWPERLAEMMQKRYEPAALRSFLHDLTGPGKLLGEAAGKLAARRWFELLGFDADRDPELFPIDIEYLLRQVATGRLDQEGIGELRRATDPAEVVEILLRGADEVPPGLTRDYLCGAVDKRAAAGKIVAMVFQHNALDHPELILWLQDRDWGADPAEPMVQPALQYGLDHLAQCGVSRVPPDLARSGLAIHLGIPGPISPGIRLALTSAVHHLGAPQGRLVPKPRLPHFGGGHQPARHAIGGAEAGDRGSLSTLERTIRLITWAASILVVMVLMFILLTVLVR